MSGFEILGVILGTIPLVFGAFDRSKRTVDALTTYTKYAKEVQRLKNLLRGQRHIFHETCTMFLSRFTSSDQGTQDHIWSSFNASNFSPDLDEDIVQFFQSEVGDRRLAQIRETMAQIGEVLEAIGREMEDMKIESVTESEVSAPRVG